MDNKEGVKYIIIICLDLWFILLEFMDDFVDIMRNIIFNVIGIVSVLCYKYNKLLKEDDLFYFLLRVSIKEKICYEVEMGGVYGGISYILGLEVIYV